MRQKFLPVFDRLLSRKRAIIETVVDQLKNISRVEHSRHRSVMNFIVNVRRGLDCLHVPGEEADARHRNQRTVVTHSIRHSLTSNSRAGKSVWLIFLRGIQGRVRVSDSKSGSNLASPAVPLLVILLAGIRRPAILRG